MCYKLCLMILAVLGMVEFLPRANCEKNETVKSGCQPPFQTVNSGCYFFSELQMEFTEAADYCASLTLEHAYEISLAMLDYDSDEDQALLDAVAERGITYWVGAKTLDGETWTWVDGREVYRNGAFWDYSEPDIDENKCAIAELYSHDNINRALMFDYNCRTKVNFICQTGTIKCLGNFVKIGNYCYLQSWLTGLPNLKWGEARSYCQSLSVPVGYHADLAVIGRRDQNNYTLMLELVESHSAYHWIGAYENSNCDYQWVDDRKLLAESIYWVHDRPNCGNQKKVALYYWSGSYNRSKLADTSDSTQPFICQMFKDAQ